MKRFLYIIFICTLLFTGCEYDNYDAPKYILSGQLHYQGDAIGLKNSAVQLEIWQDGYDLYTSVPVSIAQDGTYSVSIVNGDFKLVRNAAGPWVDQTNDTLFVQVKGNTTFDVEVLPHFMIRNESYSINMADRTITGTFTIEQVVPTSTKSNVRMYIGPRILLDNDIRGSYVSFNDAPIGEPVNITMDITDDLIERGYLFARIGVKAAESGQYIYTQVEKYELN